MRKILLISLFAMQAYAMGPMKKERTDEEHKDELRQLIKSGAINLAEQRPPWLVDLANKDRAGYLIDALLNEWGADISQKATYLSNDDDESYHDENALHRAASNGAVKNLEILIAYIKKNPHYTHLINEANMYGETPLYNAVYNGCPQSVELLLKNGADPNKLVRRESCLHALRYNRHSYEIEKEIILALYCHGPHFDINNYFGHTPVSLSAITADRHMKTHELLVALEKIETLKKLNIFPPDVVDLIGEFCIGHPLKK